jgi:hypothetical protein
MFTIKFYDTAPNHYRQVIKAAESFTILKNDDGSAEITLHQKNAEDDRRYDINCRPDGEGPIQRFEGAIIENANGKTTQMIGVRPSNG